MRGANQGIDGNDMKGVCGLGIKNVVGIAIILSYLLIVFGAYVASSQSGMGCGPDWPLCNDEVIPELYGETLIEFAHRVIGAIVLALAVTVWILILRKQPHLRKAAWTMITVVSLLVVMGAVVVFYHLPPFVVTVHLLLAFLFYFLLIHIWHHLEDEVRCSVVNKHGIQRMRIHSRWLLFLVVMTIGLGGYIKHKDFGQVCDWLNCYNTWYPVTMDQWLQTLHRAAAVATAIYTLLLFWMAFRSKVMAGLRTRLAMGSVIVIVQIAVGILTIVTHIPISWAVVHMTMAALLFTIIADFHQYVKK